MFKKRTHITIDYKLCGDGVGADPRECGLCLRACDPAVFLLHQTLGAHEDDPYDPQKWRVTPLWPSLCTRCGTCETACPLGAITVRPAAGAPVQPPPRPAEGRPGGGGRASDSRTGRGGAA